MYVIHERELPYLNHFYTNKGIELMLKVTREVPVIVQVHSDLILKPFFGYSLLGEDLLLDGKSESFDCTSHLCCLRDC
jgi:hypothetical protein